MEHEERRSASPSPAPDAYSQSRTIRPGCQHHLGCKCGVPYYLRDSSPAELRRERLIQLSPSGFEFISAALRVTERRRDALKLEVEQLRCEVQSLRSAPIPTPSSSPSIPLDTSIPSIPPSTFAPAAGIFGQGLWSKDSGMPGSSECLVSAVQALVGSAFPAASSETQPTPATQTTTNQISSYYAHCLSGYSRVNSTST